MSDWFAGAGDGSRLDVGVMLDTKAMERLAAMVTAGALVSLSLTSDGGALGVTVTVDGRWRREYFRQAEELELWTEEAMAPVLTACDAKPASPVPRERARGTRAR